MAENSSFENLGPRWYIAHTYTGYENRVKANIEKIVENRNMGHMIFDARVPVETVVENVNGKEKEIEVKIYPSYVFVKMCMTDETWHVVRNVRGVTGFVGPGSKPVPLTEEEVMRLGVEKNEIEINFTVGDSVSIIDGYFGGFIGRVNQIDTEKGIVRVTVSMMGKDVPVELSLDQVAALG